MNKVTLIMKKYNLMKEHILQIFMIKKNWIDYKVKNSKIYLFFFFN